MSQNTFVNVEFVIFPRNQENKYINGHACKGKKRTEEQVLKSLKSRDLEPKSKKSQICACGTCGLMTNPGRKYIQGHSFKGKKRSEESVAKNVESHRINTTLGKIEFEPRLCACNMCGLYAPPGKKYILGHSTKGKKLKKRTLKASQICACNECGMLTKPGKKYMHGHNPNWIVERERLISVYCKCGCQMMTTPGKVYVHGHNEMELSSIVGIHIETGLPFSSSCELYVIMNHPRKMDLVRADRGKYKIFIPCEDGRYHYPDFLDRGCFPNEILEVKPIDVARKPGYDRVLMKEQDGIKYADENGLVYVLKLVPCMKKYRDVFPLREKGLISLIPKWEKQYQEWIAKKNMNR